jgi:hypothetical protein
MELRAGLDELDERKFLTLPGLEHRLLGGPTRNQFLIFIFIFNINIKIYMLLDPSELAL